MRTRRLVTLHGVGGVGKSRLAIEAARARLRDREEPDGAWFVNLAPVGDPALVAATVAHSLDIRETPDEPAIEAVVETLRDRHLLLVLDCCEHVLEAAARLATRILQECPSVRLLATSREPLEIDGELVYELEPLGLPQTSGHTKHARTLDDLRASPAIQLFLDRAEDADPHFFRSAAESDPEAVAEICGRLDGLPLALELAAARVRDLTLREMCEALDKRFGLLAHGKRTAEPQHRTLRAMLEWSYGFLGENEQRVFRRLGAFAGTWTINAAAAVCGEPVDAVRDVVATLVTKSLVTVVHGEERPRRYRLLESLRAFARALSDEREAADAARLHAEYYRSRAHAAGEAWHGHPALHRDDTLDALLDDIAELRAALDWAVTERHDVVLGAELTSVLADAWTRCGLDAEGLRLLGAAHAALGASERRRRESQRLTPIVGPVGPSSEADQAAEPAWLSAFGQERAYGADEVLFHAGDEAEELLYVASGTVWLEEIGTAIEPRELLGEIAFFSEMSRRTVTARAKTDVVVRAIGRDALLELYDTDPAFRVALVRVFTRRLLEDLESVRDRTGGG